MKSSEITLIGLGLLILERLDDMEKALTDAIADLNTEVTDETTKLGSITTYIKGVPDLVAAAVATALSNAGVEESAAATEIEQARSTLQSSVDDALSAVNANTPPTDQGGGTTTTGGAPAGGDGTAQPGSGDGTVTPPDGGDGTVTSPVGDGTQTPPDGGDGTVQPPTE